MNCVELQSLYYLTISVEDAMRLLRQMRRERGRDVLQVLDQFERTVKLSFMHFILSTKQCAHLMMSPRISTLMHAHPARQAAYLPLLRT